MNERMKAAAIVFLFLGFYFIPFSGAPFPGPVSEGLLMAQEYAREHVLLCLIPAFFIAGAISNFVSQGSVIRYFGSRANKFLSYSVASVSGTILAVCSCTVLPLFAGIYTRGAGIGPATAFLYSAPAINVTAIILTARVLGLELGAARAMGAILFSVLIGLAMHVIFRRDQQERDKNADIVVPEEGAASRPLWKTGLFFAVMVGILVFANWGPDESLPLWQAVHEARWYITGFFLLALGWILIRWFSRDEMGPWFSSTWEFAVQIMPLLFGGVLIAGVLLGRPGHEALVPSAWIERAVGGNGFGANLFASVAGALMYFATLTEVPILQGLIGAGMGKGPALALLLAGPALSLPSMIVIRSIMGTRKTIIYIVLVVVMATTSGMIYGSMF